MIASLPMYARAETDAAQQRLWDAIRAGLPGPLPKRLIEPEHLMAHWLDPELAFSQTCGLPYRADLHGKVELVGTADYGLPGCPPGHYNSVFVVRRDDPRETPAEWAGMRLAYNSRNSQSGWAAPQNHMAGLGLTFTRVLSTGAHRNSAQAVADGRADIACIDAQTWRMIQRWDAVASSLREVGRTQPTPGLPFIAALGTDAEALAEATAAAIAGMSPDDRDTLGIAGFVRIPAAAYLAVPTPPPPLPATPISR